MLIDFNCNIHGINKLELNQQEAALYNFRKENPVALGEWINNNLKCPLCLKKEEIEALRIKLDLPVRFQKCSFENFEKTKQKEIVQDYFQNFDKNYENGTCLIFIGNAGTGKTHLCAALANKLIENVRPVRYIKAFDMLRQFKETYSKKSETSYDQVKKRFCKPDLLIIDEVGVQFGSDAEKQILFEVVNDRYENIKPTIIVSNLSVENLKAYVDDRVIDRMKENGGKIIKFDSKISYREKSKTN